MSVSGWIPGNGVLGRADAPEPLLMVTIVDREDVPADIEFEEWVTKPFRRRALSSAVERALSASA